MNHFENLSQYLVKSNDIKFYDVLNNLITHKISEMDRSVPRLLNKAFNHRYIISRIEKEKKEGKKGLTGTIPDYDAQIKEQYRQIYLIQLKIAETQQEFEQLKKAMIAIGLLHNYHLELNTSFDLVDKQYVEVNEASISVKYLFNKEYEKQLIDSYKDGLEKEGLEYWNISSLANINAYEMMGFVEKD